MEVEASASTDRSQKTTAQLNRPFFLLLTIVSRPYWLLASDVRQFRFWLLASVL